MNSQVIDANTFSIGQGQSQGRGFHVDGASVLRFIELPCVSWPGCAQGKPEHLAEHQ
jgi:hypothetical protein